MIGYWWPENRGTWNDVTLFLNLKCCGQIFPYETSWINFVAVNSCHSEAEVKAVGPWTRWQLFLLVAAAAVVVVVAACLFACLGKPARPWNSRKCFISCQPLKFQYWPFAKQFFVLRQYSYQLEIEQIENNFKPGIKMTKILTCNSKSIFQTIGVKWNSFYYLLVLLDPIL